MKKNTKKQGEIGIFFEILAISLDLINKPGKNGKFPKNKLKKKQVFVNTTYFFFDNIFSRFPI